MHKCRTCSNLTIKSRCLECTIKRKQERIKRKNSGICRDCSNPSIVNRIYCENHTLAHIAGSLNRYNKSIHITPQMLKDLLIKQNYICPYTGDKLIIGNNASIDHIVPKSKGGTNDLSNLEWIRTDVNIAKNDHSHEEFLNMIKLVYKNCF